METKVCYGLLAVGHWLWSLTLDSPLWFVGWGCIWDQIILDHMGSVGLFGIIWVHLELFDYLGSSVLALGELWDALGICGS